MNGNDFMRALNGLDEGFIRSAGEKQAEKHSKTNKRKIRLIAGIAAAALVALPAAAYASGVFLHHDNVEHYITGTELIAEQCPEAILNAVTENQNYRITVDSALSDGHNVMMVLTQEAKSPKGLRIKKDMSFPETYLSYADGTPGPFQKTAHSDESPRTFPDGAYAFDHNVIYGYDRTVTIMNCNGVDPEKDVTVEFFHDFDNASAMLYFWKRDAPDLLREAIPDFDFNRSITNELDGMCITMRFAQNVKCVPLYNADGAELFMSAFELYTEQENVISTTETSDYDEILGGTCEQLVPLIHPESFYLIRSSGEKELLDSDETRSKSSLGIRPDFNYFIFGKFIDPDDYMGVEIDGVQYLKAAG